MRQDDAAHTRGQTDHGGPGGSAERLTTVDYSVSRPPKFSRAWAWAFVLSGGCALASVPAVFVFEHFGWSDGPPRFAGFLAGIIWLATLAKYQKVNRQSAGDGPPSADLFQTLSRLGVALILGFIVLCAGAVLLYAFTMSEF
jgi:hypothetical protein